MFAYIVKRVKERKKSWNNIFLSEARKEVFLKSIALTMPTYAVSYFKIFLTICHEIDSLLYQFWWGTDETRCRIAWVGWKRMCHSKKDGGLRFHDIEKFNDALLVKHAWRILKASNCLLAQGLKSRYLPDTYIQHANIGKQPSL